MQHNNKIEMKVTVLQTDIKWAQPVANIDNVELLIASAPKSDLYVLPEMWSTGFVTNPQGVAENENTSVSLSWMQRTAKKYNAAISGSLAIFKQNESDGQPQAVNRHYFVKPDGTYNYYDKRHLFKYGREDKYYQSGNRRMIVEWKGIRFILLTCYDLRFPELYRRQALEGAKIIFVPAEWPVQRGKIWDLLLKARAVENHLFIVGVNCVGTFKQQHFYGHSQLIDPEGNILVCGSDREEILYGELDLAKLDQVRQVLNVLPDVRPELVKVSAGFLKKETGL